MVRKIQRPGSVLIVMVMWMVLPGCGGGGDSPSTPGGGAPQGAPQVSVDPPQHVATVNLSPGESSKQLFVDIRGASFMLIAEGETFASDVDIHSLVAPDGTTLVTADRGGDDPLGKNFLKAPGGTAVAGLFYPEQSRSIQSGRYSFRVRNNDGDERRISVKAIVKHGVNPSGGTLNVNLVFCGVLGLTASTALSGQTQASEDFLTMFNTFKRIFSDAAHIEIAKPTLIDCSPTSAKFATVFSGEDTNQNGQSDELDKLFQLHRQDEIIGLSSNLPENALTFFLIPVAELPRELKGHFDLFGVSGGIPGPAMTPGTKHSGVAVAIGNLDQLEARGRTMAHEAAHFLGLFHTTEQTGLQHDPLLDTLECLNGNDVDGNNLLDATECSGFDGNNLMFWDGDSLGTQLTDGQRLVLHRNPLVH